jgi:hypothetical protein
MVFYLLKRVNAEKSVYPRYSFNMNKTQFLEALSQSGYPEPVEVQQPPNGHLADHAHPFAVKALVIDGYIEIQIQGASKRYGVGDIFELEFNQTHSETYGPLGVKYLASRKLLIN